MADLSLKWSGWKDHGMEHLKFFHVRNVESRAHCLAYIKLKISLLVPRYLVLDSRSDTLRPSVHIHHPFVHSGYLNRPP